MNLFKIAAMLLLGLFLTLKAEVIEKKYTFDNVRIEQKGEYQIINFNDTYLAGETGTPLLPYKSVSLLLPAGEDAVSVIYEFTDEVVIEGKYNLYPKQATKPVSELAKDFHFVKDETIYNSNETFPVNRVQTPASEYLNGYSLGFSSFSPVRYNPLTGKLSYFKTVTATMETECSLIAGKALENLSSAPSVVKRISSMVQNKETVRSYPAAKIDSEAYQILIVTSNEFKEQFSPYINFYAQKGMSAKTASVEDIVQTTDGIDSAEKIRNYIIEQYQSSSIEYVLLGGDIEIVPHRGFYCTVNSPHGSSDWMSDEAIPADMYYSALDGNWNNDNDELWGEPGEDDLLQEVAVGRFPFSNSSELASLIHKTVTYQNFTTGDESKRNFLVGEWFYGDDSDVNDPFLSWGGDYLDLLVGHKEDNGYVTDGIPESYAIERLYDKNAGYNDGWDINTLITKLNEGWSSIYHFGHSNYDYTMRMSNWDITNGNFSELDGETHNYVILNTGGCMCGGFDVDDCIGEKIVNIDNFAAAFIGNSRYGWNNEGSTDGPGTTLQRHYVDALYGENLETIGEAFHYSKQKTAPFVIMDEQWEEGATRWNFYDQNLLGDPAMKVWKGGSSVGPNEVVTAASVSLYQNYPNPFNPATSISYELKTANNVNVSVFNGKGEVVWETGSRIQAAGRHSVEFDGSQFNSGVYFYSLSVAGEKVQSRKMLLVK